MNGWAIAGTSFLASAVEMVEALTIVLAVGFTRGWRPALAGTLWALLALAAIVGIAGPLLVTFVPIRILRLAIGAFALWFGWTWLRKAILRASGRKALHDETAIYEAGVAELHAQRDRNIGLAMAFKGVFVEGLEVAMIVVTIGTASSGALAWASAGALIALVIVLAAGVALHRPLARVPENALKFAVGIALVTFGIFWLAEGAGFAWPGADLAILGIAVAVAAISFIAVTILRRSATSAPSV